MHLLFDSVNVSGNPTPHRFITAVNGGGNGGVNPGGSVLETEDGNVLETEDGKAIELEQ